MNKENEKQPGAGNSGKLNAKTVSLLKKALAVSPGDWETRSHLALHYLASDDVQRAYLLVKEAPIAAETEQDLLLCGQIQAAVEPAAAIQTFQSILQRNKACAQAYLGLAMIYRKQGLKEEAGKKYGAATLLDETLSDPEWEKWLDNPPAALKETFPGKVAVGPAGSDDVTAEEIAEALESLAESPGITGRRFSFADIGGMEDVIERIRMNILHPFKNPQLFQKFNRSPGGGILLYGPPGCGKTHIARATAGECGATFIPIAITDVLSKWLGESERHLHEIFEAARRRAPAVIFIDEIDAIGMNRNDASSSLAPLVNVLLTEMDGIAADNRSVMVLGATNAPWRVDGALRRPGRFDRVIFVPPPDAPAREAILNIHLRDVPVESLDPAKIARLTEKFSGADLRALVGRASEQAIMLEMKTGVPAKLSQKMFVDAVKGMRPSTVEWLETARNYASYANRAGLYDDLVAYFESK